MPSLRPRFLSGNILVFSFTDLLGNIARKMVFPYASLYILALGGDANRIGWINFIGLLAGLLILPIAGYITDHADRIRLLVLSGFLSSLLLVMMVLAPNWQVVALASLLFGSVVFQFPAYASLIADSLHPTDRGRGMGLMGTISLSLAIFAPYIAGLVIERFTTNLGMRILYSVMLVMYLVSAVVQQRFLRETTHHQRTPLHAAALTHALQQAYQSVPGLIKAMSSPMKALAVVVLLSFLANAVATSFWVVYAIDQAGLSASEWGLILLSESVIGLLAFYPAGLLVDRWGRKNTLLLGLLISLVAIPMFVVVKGFISILLVRAAISISFVLGMLSSSALMADLVPSHLRGQVMSAIGQGGIMIAPAGGGIGGPSLGYLLIPPVMVASLVSGYLYTLQPTLPWLISTVTTFISIIITILYLNDPHQAEI